MGIITKLRDVVESRAVDWALRLSAVVAIIATGIFGIQQHRQQECIERYATLSAASTLARAEAAEVDRVALDTLMRKVATTPRGTFQAVVEYNTTRALADERRRLNPVPPPPANVCGS